MRQQKTFQGMNYSRLLKEVPFGRSERVIKGFPCSLVSSNNSIRITYVKNNKKNTVLVVKQTDKDKSAAVKATHNKTVNDFLKKYGYL